ADLYLVALCVAVVANPVQSAIDCSRAQTNTEKLLCSNSRLMMAEEHMAHAFREAIKRGAQPKALMESQRIWIRDVRDVCVDVECMLRAHAERTSELDNLP
ncbi:MAG: hypothetical protein ABI619_07370, partial [Betaproteobacteria bacterium]